MLYILYYESANYCGYGQHAVVRANNETEAELLADGPMEDYFYEQDQDQYLEDYGDDEGVTWANMRSCEELTPEHASWKYVVDPGQASFYDFVNLEQSELQ